MDIKRQWFLANKDLSRNSINTNFGGNMNVDGKDLGLCSLRNNPKFANTNADNCVEMQLSETYNYTVKQTAQFGLSRKTYGHILSGIPSVSEVNKLLLTFSGTGGPVWIIHGVKIEPYHFAIITDPYVMNLSTIFMPFDGITWILLGTILTLFSILLGVSHTKFELTRVLKVHLFWASSAFLEQSNPKPFQQTARQNRMPVLILLWLILSFFCGVFYKGSLYSFVTARQSPTVPLSLEKIVKEDLAIMMSTTIGHYPELICPLGIILQDLLSSHVDSSSDSFSLLLTKIFSKTEWLIGDESELAKNISLGRNVQVHPNSTLRLPPTFVMLNGATDLTSFIQSMKYFSKSLVIKSQEETPFVFRVPWLVTRNFFYDLFSHGLGALVESGVYQRWR
ncbi:hypothetical protein Fcan01_04758 [Folsomia candida]|uniref:Uncharacterized protein n=1 Tax=Folsomia candida TaxID=158441 RepID=A0A226ES66_FOLCA|nr:hypothetical protein Fcan01_04758 [Folsomia candida]